MNIKFNGKYKSLKTFEWTDIPQLAIVTGLNGAGKSQLLELIDNYLKQLNPAVANAIKLEITGKIFSASEVIFLKGEWGLTDPAEVDLARIQASTSALLKQMISGGPDLDRYMTSDYKRYKKLTDIKAYFIGQGKGGAQITQEEFREQLDNSKITDEKTLVQSVSEFFYNYRLDYLDRIVKGETEVEIIGKIGVRPWNVLRDIIEEANLPFEITDPEQMGIRGSYKLSIRKTTTGDLVKFDELSSGERVLFSLAFIMFNSQEIGRFPKLLLLDEPDAHLHPLMTFQLLNVLKNVLADKYGVQIILTTHSPSTVAISKEESIFLMDASIGYPQPIEKDLAIKSLLAGIPNVYVSYQDRRQVFVESENDVSFYDKFYKRLFPQLDQDVNLNFISSGDSATDKNKQPISNCDQVIKITGILTDAGNPHIYGIIDFDEGKNRASEKLIILGDGNRYSIENYILDPLAIGLLLLREKIISAQEAGADGLKYTDVETHTAENLQILSNYVVAKVNAEVKSSRAEVSACKLINGITLDIPTWYLMHQGHALEEILIKVFPKLGEIKKNKEAQLKLTVIDKVFDDYPGLISKDILNAFLKIQS